MGLTPLHTAKSGCAVSVLLDRGHGIDVRDDYGGTPLHHVFERDVVSELIRRGSNINATDSDGNTPLHRYLIHWLLYEDFFENWLSGFLEIGAAIDARNNNGHSL